MKTKIIIEINTDMKKITEKDFDKTAVYPVDLTEQVEKVWHNALYDYIEKGITDNEELEGDIIEKMREDWEIPESFKEFMDLGSLQITITQEPKKQEEKEE